MMPVMPMDPVSRAAAVAQAMMETTASQSMEPGPGGDLAGGPASAAAAGAADVMPVPPSTSMAAGTSVSLAPSELRGVVREARVPDAQAVGQASSSTSTSETSSSERERTVEKGSDLSAPVVLGDLHATALMGPQRRRVEREARQGQRPRRPSRPVADEEGPAEREQDDAGEAPTAAPRRPLSMAQLRQTVLRHAGGLAWTEWHEGRRVIVLDTAQAHEGLLRGALLSLDAQDQKAAMVFKARTAPGWGWAWSRLSGRHWRLCRDLDPAGHPVLLSPADTGVHPFCISLHHADPSSSPEGQDGTLMRIHLSDPLRFQRRLGRQWTYLALLQSLDHEHDEPPAPERPA